MSASSLASHPSGSDPGGASASSSSGKLGPTRWITPVEDSDAVLSTPSSSADNVTVEDNSVDQINYIAYGIVANIIVAVGIVGNILNLIVLTRPKLKGVMYVYLLGLAVSNLCVLFVAIPALMDLVGAIKSQTYATAFFKAHLELPLLNSFMASSVYIIICMTVNRYISIYKPTHFQRIHTFKNAYIAILFSFVGGMVLHIPLSFEQGVQEICSAPSHCIYKTETIASVAEHSLYRVYLYVSEALLRAGPIITLTILNALIIVRFHRIALKREVLKGGAASQHRGSTSGLNPPASPYSNGNGPSMTSGIGMSNGCSSSVGHHSNRLSVTAVNGKLAVPSCNGSSVANTASTYIHDDRTTSVYHCNDVIIENGPPVSRSTTPLPSTYSSSPSKLLHRGTPQRASTRRRGLHNPEERMLVMVLIAIVLLFVFCTSPAAVLSILVTEQLKKQTWFAIFRAVANNLELLCFALNFFVYCLCSADIRRAFVDVLFENTVVQYLRRKSFKATAIELTTVNNGPENV